MEPEELDEFESELRQALERRPAPPALKRRLMERRAARAERPGWLEWIRGAGPGRAWAPAVAALLLVALAGGGLRWEQYRRQEEQSGEAARQQVMTALRITGHALNEVQERLNEHERPGGEGDR